MKPAFLLLCLFPVILVADEDPQPETSLHTGVNLTRGNQDTLLFELGGETLRPFGDQSLRISASYAYGQTETDEEDITTQDTSNARLRYEAHLEAPWFAYVDTEALRDEIAAIDYRFTLGPGVGTRIVKTEAMDLAFEVGGAWVAEQVDDEADDSAALRVGQTFTWTLSDNASLKQSLDYLRKFDDEHEEIINARLTVMSILTGNLSLRLDLKNRYESEPAAGKESNNLTFTAGIAVKL